jgi:hypothetical protein
MTAAVPRDPFEAILELARDDATVFAVLKMMHRHRATREETLAQLVLYLAKDKAALTAQLVDAARNTPPAG